MSEHERYGRRCETCRYYCGSVSESSIVGVPNGAKEWCSHPYFNSSPELKNDIKHTQFGCVLHKHTDETDDDTVKPNDCVSYVAQNIDSYMHGNNLANDLRSLFGYAAQGIAETIKENYTWEIKEAVMKIETRAEKNARIVCAEKFHEWYREFSPALVAHQGAFEAWVVEKLEELRELIEDKREMEEMKDLAVEVG